MSKVRSAISAGRTFFRLLLLPQGFFPDFLRQSPEPGHVQNPESLADPLENPFPAKLPDHIHKMPVGDNQIFGQFRVFDRHNPVTLKLKKTFRQVVPDRIGGKIDIVDILGHVLLQSHAAAGLQKPGVIEKPLPAAIGIDFDEAAPGLGNEREGPLALLKKLRDAKDTGRRKETDQGQPRQAVRRPQGSRVCSCGGRDGT